MSTNHPKQTNMLSLTFVVASVEVFDLFDLFLVGCFGGSCYPQPPSVCAVPGSALMPEDQQQNIKMITQAC
jgi:hypothetical protein